MMFTIKPMLKRGLRLSPLLAVLLAALLGPSVVDAQSGRPNFFADTHRNLSIESAFTTAGQAYLVFTVFNNSEIPLENIKVQLTSDQPGVISVLRTVETIQGIYVGAPPEVFDGETGLWTIPRLEPSAFGESVGGYASRQTLIIRRKPNSPLAADTVARIRAEIIDSTPKESVGQEGDNRAERWVYLGQSSGIRFANPMGVLSLSADNERPSPGGPAVFTADILLDPPRDTVYRKSVLWDVQVRITLSDGLVFGSTAPSADVGAFTRESSTAGTWRISRTTGRPTLSVPVRLTAGDLPPLDERCLTAQIVSSRPTTDPDKRAPVSLCFLPASPSGEHRVVSSGEVDLFEVRYCLGVTAFPCNDRDTLELVVEHGGQFLEPESVVVVVDPAAGLHSDGTIRSLGVGLRPYINWLNVPAAPFSRAGRAIEVPEGITLPGSFSMRPSTNLGFNYLDPVNAAKAGPFPYTTPFRAGYDIWFESPGQYKVTVTFSFTHATRDDDNDGNNDVFDASGTYTFIVGIAGELAVMDAGQAGAIPRGQRGYTLMARNNGQSTVPEVEVELSGVPQGARAQVSEDGGSYRQGGCAEGLCQGTWHVGDLEGRDARLRRGRSDGPTLTLLSGAANAPVTASIVSKRSEKVTVGGTTHTFEFMDVDDSNNQATIKAIAGTGQHPDAVRSFRVEKYGPIAVLRWEPPEDGRVYRWPVARYEVERNGRVMDLELRETLYVDLRRGSSGASYRLRAVSDQGVPGPWSSFAGSPTLLETANVGPSRA